MIELTDHPIDVARALEAVTRPHCGAEVLFVGTTRRWTVRPAATAEATPEQIETSHLIYDCYREMAVAQLERLAAVARQRWPVEACAIVHRLGRVEPGEASVAVAVSCPHRGEAFEAARWLMDEIKHQVPIWKQEHYVQSGPEWIHPTSGSCRCVDPAPQRPNAPHDTWSQQSQQQ